MPVSDCCRRDKPDLTIRVGLRVVDNRGKEHCETLPRSYFAMIASRGAVNSDQASNAGCSIKSCSERISLNPQWRSPDVERSFHSVPFGLSLLHP